MWSHLLSLLIIAHVPAFSTSEGVPPTLCPLCRREEDPQIHMWMKSGCFAGQMEPLLINAIVHLLVTDPLRVSADIHVVFQDEIDECFVTALFRSGLPAKVMTSQNLDDDLVTSYYEYSQRVIVGDLDWIKKVMEKAKPHYRANNMNLKRTHWYWVVTSNIIPTSREINSTSLALPSSIPTDAMPSGTHSATGMDTFTSAMEEVSGTLSEGVSGLLFFVTNSSQQKWVTLGGVKAAGDGNWSMGMVGSWSAAGLKVLDTIWPKPPFNLKGRIVRMSCLLKPTVFEFTEGDRLHEAGGYAADLMKEMEQRLNFSSVLVPTDTFGSEKADGSWTGMVGALVASEADIAPLDFSPVYERALVVDFSIVYNTDNVIILTNAPSEAVRPFLLLQIFSPFVWLSLFVVSVAAGVVIGLLLRARLRMGRRESGMRSVPAYAFASLKLLVFIGSDCWPIWSGGRIVSGAMMFLAVIAGALYGGSITAFLAIPFRSKPLNSLEDLAASHTLPAFRYGASPYNFFIKQTEGVLGETNRRMKVFSGIETTEWSFMKSVADGIYAFIDTWSSVVGRANLFEERGKPCLFHLGRDPVRMDLDAFAYPKNSPIIYQFDEIMRWFRCYGIIQNFMKKYYGKTCNVVFTSDGPRPLTLLQTQGAFYVLVVGIATSFSAFIGEFVFFKAFAYLSERKS